MNDHTAKADLYAYDLTGAAWRKSSHSAGEGQCVELTDLPAGGKAVRDGKNRRLPAVRYTAQQWEAFRQAVTDGTL
ncbi:DUF397 domain-containing protein [Streptomyces sp. NPDC127105]|uniref:DUF397 domain-containing protein n=1 Tax=Streptomyces sp. NPDC127105 TaxID=3345359 RepID=UPI0036509A6E